MPARSKLAWPAVVAVGQNVWVLVDEPLWWASRRSSQHNLEVVAGERLDGLVKEPPLECSSRGRLNHRPHELTDPHVLDANICHLPCILLPHLLWPVLRVIADTDCPVPLLDDIGCGGSGILAPSTQVLLQADCVQERERQGRAWACVMRTETKKEVASETTWNETPAGKSLEICRTTGGRMERAARPRDNTEDEVEMEEESEVQRISPLCRTLLVLCTRRCLGKRPPDAGRRNGDEIGTAIDLHMAMAPNACTASRRRCHNISK